MSAYQIDWLLNERVIFGKMLIGYDVRRDTWGVSNRLSALLNIADRPAPVILDLTDLSVGMKHGALNALAQVEGGALRHRKLIELLIVDSAVSTRRDTPNPVQVHFGGHAARLFPSTRAALGYAHDKYGTRQISVN